MKRKVTALIAATILTGCSQDAPESLKEAFEGKFLIGAALNSAEINGTDPEGIAIVRKHFNSIVAENCMKCEKIHPREDIYDFSEPDRLVDFGQENGMFIVGHCLIWHSQLAPWFSCDSLGRPAGPELLKARMKRHITNIVSRYKGRVQGWDVVNESILEDGSFRHTPFYDALGEEYIALAFKYAHEADPDAELYLNDYGMDGQKKREAYVKLIRKLKEQGIRIDAVGMQGHMGMDYPDTAEFGKSIRALAAEGVKVMITEWDMSALPTIRTGAELSDTNSYRAAMNPYPDGLPEDISEVWNSRMASFMELFVKHSDQISRVTAWGVSDDDSWKNGWPMPGRTDYPLLFDRELEPKPFLGRYIRTDK